MTGLIYLVNDAVSAVAWPLREHEFRVDSSVSFPGEKLLKLEVYCYARGVYGSDDVGEIIRQDPVLRELFPDEVPEGKTLVKFRRENRAVIRDCLLKVFEAAFIIRFGEPDSEAAPVDYCVALALDRWFAPMCGPQPDREAEERLGLAVFTDGMSNTS